MTDPDPVPVPQEAREAWASLASATPYPARFDAGMTVGLPRPVRRWLARSIKPGTPLWECVELKMHGEIRLNGNWLPFKAHQMLAPRHGFVWAARASMRGLTIRGYDRYTAGTGQMRWRVLGLIPVMTAEGADITKSAAGRLAGEGVLLPTSFATAVWRPGTDVHTAVMSRTVDGETEDVQLTIDEEGRLTDVVMQRWGDPDGTGFARYPFGVHIEQESSFEGVTIATTFRAGWWKGTPRETTGEFFRATVTSAVFH